MTSDTQWETVIGLEVHVELDTRTKLFSGAPNSFGNEPNTNIDVVSLGLPGCLPVLNEQAVELAIRCGLALGCEIRPSIFARKNYFYPDMPKDYQISQYDQPICAEGMLELPYGRRIGIERAHLEEDTGKSVHVGGSGRIHGADHSLVDYNRAGVPLLEIVSRPDLRSADEARAYVEELRGILVATAVSDARMEEGSMRVDANVSVRPAGSDELRTRCEVKNLNSLRSLGRAIDHEVARHIDLYEAGDEVDQETRHWDEDGGRTYTLRSKEEAHDYRYFPEPDLVRLDPDQAWIEAIRAALPMLPAELRRRVEEATGVGVDLASIVVEREMHGLATDAVAEGAAGDVVVNHIVQNLADGAGEMDATAFAKLCEMQISGELTTTQAKDVLAELVASGGDPAALAAALGYEAMDTGDLEGIVDEIIANHPEEWQRFCDGERSAGGWLVGQVMQATNRQADGKVVNKLLNQKKSGHS